jgi:hypothetical protein
MVALWQTILSVVYEVDLDAGGSAVNRPVAPHFKFLVFC